MMNRKEYMTDKPALQQIDDIIASYEGWKGEIIGNIRKVIRDVDPDVVETVKWKTASRPEGLPVWEHGGILCIAEAWKDNVKLVFFKGTQMRDEHKLFNARLQSSTDRAIEFREGDTLDEEGLRSLVIEAIELNQIKNKR